MVSTDHFRYELQAQMRRATTQGRLDILVNCAELHRSTSGRAVSLSGTPSCCDAMQEEMRLGDVLLLDRDNGAGMTVRYHLPRTAGI